MKVIWGHLSSPINFCKYITIENNSIRCDCPTVSKLPNAFTDNHVSLFPESYLCHQMRWSIECDCLLTSALRFVRSHVSGWRQKSILRVSCWAPTTGRARVYQMSWSRQSPPSPHNSFSGGGGFTLRFYLCRRQTLRYRAEAS